MGNAADDRSRCRGPPIDDLPIGLRSKATVKCATAVIFVRLTNYTFCYPFLAPKVISK
jgi:hypothetical protein